MSNCPDSYRDIEASFESKRSDLRFDNPIAIGST
jgi:hypothetical protein